MKKVSGVSQLDAMKIRKRNMKSRRDSSSSSSSSSSGDCSSNSPSHRNRPSRAKRKRDASSESTSSSSSHSSSSSSSDSSTERKRRKKKLKRKLLKVQKKEEKARKKAMHKEKKAKRKLEKLEKKQAKRKAKEERKAARIREQQPTPTADKADDGGALLDCGVPLGLMNRKARAPETREEYEARQSIIRRVVDPSTGRARLIKGDGEIIEEFVSRERHQEINRQATAADGAEFQRRTVGFNNVP